MVNGNHMTPEQNWYLRLYSYIQEKRKRDVDVIRFSTFDKARRNAILKYGYELGYRLSFVWKKSNGLYEVTIVKPKRSKI